MTTYVDTFNRTDAATLGTASGGWTWTEWSAGFTIVSNRARQESEAVCGAFSPAQATGNHYAEVTVASFTAGISSAIGPIVRAASVGAAPVSTGAFYTLRISGTGMDSWAIRSKDPSSANFVTLASATQAITAGDVLRLEAEGSNLRAYRNGVLVVSYASAVLTDQLQCGIFNDAGTGAVIDWDDFTAADLGSSASAPHASGTGEARSATIGLAPAAGHTLGTGVAYQPTIASSAIAAAAERASSTGSAHDPVVTATSVSEGSWYGLLSILQAARAEAGQPHREDDECPHDGTIYEAGPDGQPWCPFDGFRPGGRTT